MVRKLEIQENILAVNYLHGDDNAEVVVEEIKKKAGRR